jgi:SulP family sulfate permease
MVVAIIVASFLPALFGWESVTLVNDIAEITRSIPRPVLPDFSLTLTLLAPAFSLAVIGLIQGAGVSQSFVNPDGKYPNLSRDFVGQGAANVAVSFLRGMPVGGSTSATALVVNGGARTRLANIFAGVVMIVVVLLFAGAVGRLAMPALAALLILIGFRTFKPAGAIAQWRTGNIQRTVMVITFALVLVVPLQYAVIAGAGLSILLYVVQQSNRVVIKAWLLKEGQLPIEQPPPDVIVPESVNILVPYGSLFYAAAPVFEGKLPAVDVRTKDAVVILNLRGVKELGGTFMNVMDRYAEDLLQHESRLMLAEVHPDLREQLLRAGIVDSVTSKNIFLRTQRVGESLYEANAAAHEWVARRRSEPDRELPGESSDSGSANSTNG